MRPVRDQFLKSTKEVESLFPNIDDCSMRHSNPGDRYTDQRRVFPSSCNKSELAFVSPTKRMIREAKFEAIWRLHADEIYRYTRSMLGNRADAEDATQETLLRLWRSLSDVQFSKSRAWLYRTARNVCIDHLRKRATRQAESFDDDESWESPTQSAPESNLDRESFRERIDQCLENLSETQRSVFILYEVNELRYREIADTLDLPMNTVKVYLSRARENIRKQLMKEGIWTTPCNR